MKQETNALPVQVQEEKKAVSEIVAGAKGLIIQDDATLATAVNYVKDFIKPRKARAEEIFNNPKTGICALAHVAWKSTVKLRDEILDPYEDARKIIDIKILKYRMDERTRREEEARILREAQEKERQKRIDAANKKIQRLVEKAGGLEAQAVELQAVILSPESTEEDVMAAWAALASIQDKQEALSSKIEEKAAEIEEVRQEPAPIVAAEAPKAAGMSAYSKKKAIVTDPAALIRAIADAPQMYPVTLVKEWNQKNLDNLVNMGIVPPGVRTEDREVVRI